MNSGVSDGVEKRHWKCTVCCNVIPPSQQGYFPRERVVCVSCSENSKNLTKEGIVKDRKRKSSHTEGAVVDLTSDDEGINVMIVGEPILSILLASRIPELYIDKKSTKFQEAPTPLSLRRRKMSNPKRFVPVATDS